MVVQNGPQVQQQLSQQMQALNLYQSSPAPVEPPPPYPLGSSSPGPLPPPSYSASIQVSKRLCSEKSKKINKYCNNFFCFVFRVDKALLKITEKVPHLGFIRILIQSVLLVLLQCLLLLPQRVVQLESPGLRLYKLGERDRLRHNHRL